MDECTLSCPCCSATARGVNPSSVASDWLAPLASRNLNKIKINKDLLDALQYSVGSKYGIGGNIIKSHPLAGLF